MKNRDRIRRHATALLTLAAAATLSTAAFACDPMPPPSRIPVNTRDFSVLAGWAEDALGLYVDVTIAPLQGSLTFDAMLSEVDGAIVVSSKGGAQIVLRLRPASAKQVITGVIRVRAGEQADAERLLLHIDTSGPPKVGAPVPARLGQAPPLDD